MLSTKPARGTKDILPKEMEIRQYIMSKVLPVYQSYGFTQIATPAIENISQLTGGQGGDNEKMVFQILKRGQKLDIKNAETQTDLVDLGLRFDLTVPLARFYANNQATLPHPFKAIQVDSVWRAERPQKGRFRQFTQCDIDVFGSSSEMVEIELVLATSQALSAIGFDNLTIRINDRNFLNELARVCDFSEHETPGFFVIFDKLDKIGLEGVEKELVQGGYSQVSVDKFLEKVDVIINQGVSIDTLESLLPELDSQALNRMKNIFNSVTGLLPKGITLKLDLALVRGMGYYTGTIFEIESQDFNSSIAGGGRYDKMIGRMLKKDIPACGFSIGFERIIQILLDKNFTPEGLDSKVAVLYDSKVKDTKELIEKVSIIRNQNQKVLVLEKAKNMTKQLNDLLDQGVSKFASFRESQELEFKELKK